MLLDSLRGKGVSEKVLGVMDRVDRKEFVGVGNIDQAYMDIPLLIGEDQTISQPFTVGLMLDLLEVHKGMKVLEIGTGSGYNAALLGVLVGEKGRVVSLEVRERLVNFAIENLSKMDLDNTEIVRANGYFGYIKDAPYDRVIITAGVSSVPEPVFDQLKEGGVMVVPVRERGVDVMRRIVKGGKDERCGEFAFVDFVEYDES